MEAGKLEKLFLSRDPLGGKGTGGWLETSQLWLGFAVLRLPVSILPGQLSAACSLGLDQERWPAGLGAPP